MADISKALKWNLINPISTGEVFPPPLHLFFACNFFVLNTDLIKFRNFKPGSRDMTIFGEWFW